MASDPATRRRCPPRAPCGATRPCRPGPTTAAAPSRPLPRHQHGGASTAAAARVPPREELAEGGGVARGSRTGGASVLVATSEASAQLWTPGPEHPAAAGAGCALHTPAPASAGNTAAASESPPPSSSARAVSASSGSSSSSAVTTSARAAASPRGSPAWEPALDGRRSRRGRPVGCGRSPAAGWAQAGPRPQPPAVAARRRRGCRASDGAAALWTSGREWLPAVGAAWRIEKEVKEMRRIYI